MDAVVKSLLERPQPQAHQTNASPLPRPNREEAEAAVEVLLRWAGDSPSREGLRDTPKRVVSAYEELYSGYHQDAADVLNRVFEEVHGYDDIVLVRQIPFSSHCEHHMVPFFGAAHVAYYPSEVGVVGLSKLARLIRQAVANPRGTDRADYSRDRPALAPARLRSHARSPTHVHVHARRAQTWLGDDHDAIHRYYFATIPPSILTMLRDSK